jgi:hypothetical protein
MSLTLQSGKAYPWEAEKAEATVLPKVAMKVHTDPANCRSYSDVIRAGSPSCESGMGGVAKGNRPWSASNSNMALNEGSIEIPRRSCDAETDTKANTQWIKVMSGSKSVNASLTRSLKLIVFPNRFEHLHVDQVNTVEQAEKRLTAAKLKLFHAQTKVSKDMRMILQRARTVPRFKMMSLVPQKERVLTHVTSRIWIFQDQKWSRQNSARLLPCGMRSNK